MIIREANSGDISEIVKVLKLSLGEADLPLSEEIWNYKHVGNPFGESLVLIAIEDDKIIGVRAFMRWQWQLEDKILSCYRAVDTATHPEHQGKGVFKKLTLKAVDLAREKNGDFIFNTPNANSRPGYLKMGWKSAGKIAVALQPAWGSFYNLGSSLPDVQWNYAVSDGEIENLCLGWNERLQKRNKIYTPKSSRYLKWRYMENPLQNYEIMATSKTYLAAYIKKRKGIKELRIAECIFTGETGVNQEIRNDISRMAKKFGAQVITFSPNLLDLNQFSVKGDFGPILTVRDLDSEPAIKELYSACRNWAYSLGDLELF